MVWRSRTTTQDRFFAALVYLLPLIRAYMLLYWPITSGGSGFGRPIISVLGQFLPIDLILLPLRLLAIPYISITGLFSIGPLGIGDFLIFIILIVAVVRNESIAHFVRFNTMQSIIVGIALSLFAIVWRLIFNVSGSLQLDLSLLTLFVVSGLFLGTAAICIYSMVQSATGKYAEIPIISNAAYVQVP
ncbi:MAG: hypothetical protein F6K30_07305 [Cyanothece sp. SIO2G6]|nr:hypothetical protein [Cyanothece sp. SIO2G6]